MAGSQGSEVGKMLGVTDGERTKAHEEMAKWQGYVSKEKPQGGETSSSQGVFQRATAKYLADKHAGEK